MLLHATWLVGRNRRQYGRPSHRHARSSCGSRHYIDSGNVEMAPRRSTRKRDKGKVPQPVPSLTEEEKLLVGRRLEAKDDKGVRRVGNAIYEHMSHGKVNDLPWRVKLDNGDRLPVTFNEVVQQNSDQDWQRHRNAF